MQKSPGHREHPEHNVREDLQDGRVRVEIAGQTVADSRAVIRVDEDGQPSRYYFPRADVQEDVLSPSDTETRCPFKGLAHYFDVHVGERTFRDAVWSYEDPYVEHEALKQRLAFYEEKFPELTIRVEEPASSRALSS